MTARSVTTDLSAAYSGGSGELTDADSTTGWSEPSGSGGTSGDTYSDLKSFAIDTEFKIEGTGAIGGAWTTNSPERGGVLYNNNSTTVPTDGAILVWMWFIAPSALSAYNIGGMWVATGNSTSALNIFRVSGNNFQPAPKGGWYCFAVDPSQTAERYEQVGSPTSTINYIGGGVACTTQMSRGLTHVGIDAIRIGRCKLVVVGGTSTDPDADFASTSTLLEAQGSGKFGIFELEGGAFFMQGLFQFGDNTSGTGEVDFTDSNKTINIRNTPAVGANFNKFDLQNGSTVTSNISLTSCTFTNLGVGDTVAATASRGDWVNTDDVNLDLVTCTFVDMGTFAFDSLTTCTGTTFRRCESVTSNAASFTDCIFDNPTITSGQAGLIVADLDEFDTCSFTKAVSNTHAVELTAAADGTWDSTATGYTTGSTGNGVQLEKTVDSGAEDAAIFVNLASGTVNISVSSGATIPSVAVPSGSTCTVNVTANQVDLTLTGIIAESAANISSGAESSEVRIYSHGTTTELAGIEDVVETTPGSKIGTFTYTYTYAASTYVDIVVHHQDYKYYRIDNYLLGSGDASLPIQQIYDRNYNNPT